jgi:hypothetical protein
MKCINFTDEELKALKALADMAVRAGGIEYVPNAYMVLKKMEEAKEVKEKK